MTSDTLRHQLPFQPLETSRRVRQPEWHWVTSLDSADRQRLFLDLESASAAARAADSTAPIEACLRGWRATAEAVDTAALRDRLLERLPG